MNVSFVCLACLVASLTSAAPAWPPPSGELAAFFDPIFASEMKQLNVPGAVIAVVHGEDIVFSKGYGSTRCDGGVPIDPAVTLFRVASLSKLFTATAVMQLVERGKLDLHADVNSYLKEFQLPATYPEPVTLADLLTHTAGFDDRYLGAAARTPAEEIPLGVYLAKRMPPRVMPPGLAMSYSNHGYALAGYIVEAVSGTPFAQYVAENIFKPLEMTHSSFTLVPGPDTPLAQGYDFYFGKNHPALYDYPYTVPASTLVVTAEDMAHFMSAHLQNGLFHGKRILNEDTARLMHQRHFTHHPKMSGWTYGFAEAVRNGRHALQHTGQIWGFSSLILLLPDEDTGLFISLTTDSGQLYNVASTRFLDRYFPAPPPEPFPADLPRNSAVRIGKAAGFYRNNRYCRTTFFKVSTMIPRFVDEIHIKPGNEPGALFLSHDGVFAYGRDETLTEIEPWYFQRILKKGGNRSQAWLAAAPRAAFRVDNAGAVTHLFVGASAYERIHWYETRPFLAALVIACILVFLVTAIAAPVRAWIRRRKKIDSPSSILHRLSIAVSILNLAFVAGMALFILTLNPNSLGYGPPSLLVMLLTLPVVCVPFAAAHSLGMAIAWIRRRQTVVQGVFHAGFALAAWVFLVVLYYWNLLGYQFG